jgi:ABC-type uncharacterized transport system ATPase component
MLTERKSEHTASLKANESIEIIEKYYVTANETELTQHRVTHSINSTMRQRAES